MNSLSCPTGIQAAVWEQIQDKSWHKPGNRDVPSAGTTQESTMEENESNRAAETDQKDKPLSVPPLKTSCTSSLFSFTFCMSRTGYSSALGFPSMWQKFWHAGERQERTVKKMFARILITRVNHKQSNKKVNFTFFP